MTDKLPVRTSPEVRFFLSRVVNWAEGSDDISSIALVGSYARGEQAPSSDIDLILLSSHTDILLNDQNWIATFGDVDRIEVEEWGKVTSLRTYYFDGLEVEFGIAGLDWASDPSDKGDALVIEDGIIVLYDIDGDLSEKVSRFRKHQ